jgi:tripartite-type tricarboxylate transporter receptor subunit TctC
VRKVTKQFKFPAITDFVPGYEASAGIGAPANTPVEIIDRLNREINAAFTDPVMKARLLDTGGAILPGSPADFGQLISAETAKWAKVIKVSKPTP